MPTRFTRPVVTDEDAAARRPGGAAPDGDLLVGAGAPEGGGPC
jgi:hypothetical protein